MSRAGWSWARGGVLAFSCFACAKIVGITDTNVTRDDEVGAAQGGGAGMGSDVMGSNVVAQPGVAGAVGSTALGGTGGVAGVIAPPSVAGAGGVGSGGSPTTTLGSAGAAPIAAACTDQAARCGAAGREVCTTGAWQATPCPPETPTCEGEGQCVVRGPALVSVGGVFLIDATEVTVAQYRQFVTAKNGDVSGQIAACSWNQSYFEEVAYEPDDEPITMVDWCDANAYCAWAGKRLCGRVGGGPIATAELDDQTLNQWYLACGGPSGRQDPNDDLECNLSMGFRSVAPVATYPKCEGYYPGVFDMLGNVWEWVDGCETNTGPDDICNLMGGSTINGDSYCSFHFDNSGVDEAPWHRSEKVLYAGIRCCAG